MASAEFLKRLRKLIPETVWQPVITSLRQDPLVWNALRDESFWCQALAFCGSDVETWNPAQLGLLILGSSLKVSALHEKPASQLDPDLASRLLDLSTDPKEPSPSLESAILIALLALEKFYQTGQWQRALGDLLERQSEIAPSVLACLIPISPDPVALGISLLTGNLFPEPAVRRSLLTHAILSNPLMFDQQVDLIERILSSLPEADQLDYLSWLKQNNLTGLASPVAEHLLVKSNTQEKNPEVGEIQTEEKRFDIDTVYTQAMLQKLSGKVDESKQTLAHGLDLLKNRQDKLLNALDAIDKPAGPPTTVDPNGDAQNPENMVPESAVENAKQMMQRISQLIQNGEFENAKNLLDDAQQLFPNDPEIVRLQADIARQNGRTTDTIDALQTAVMLKPDDLSLRKTLAATYEEQGSWQDALEERMSILKYFPNPPEQELLSVAAAAIRANQLSVAETACQTILDLQPENGQANAIYGELMHAKGDDEKALLHLTHATTLSPDLPAPWLVISRIYRDQGNETFSIDTLKAAAQVLPDSPEIQFALGENCLANSSPSEALVYLRKAFKYDPTSPTIAMRLGEILTTLGLFVEADRILENARQTRSNDPDLAQIHSRTLLGLGNVDGALDAITTALEADPQNTNILSTLSEIFEKAITENQSLSQAMAGHPKLKALIPSVQSYLEMALNEHPESIELQILAADLLVESGSPEQALIRYQNLLQKLPYKHPALWRAQFGLGRIALKLGQLDAALVALKEASQLMPDRSDILRALAETYQAANLTREALDASHAVVELDAANTDGFLWQADLILKLGDPDEAAKAIEKALSLEPDRPELILKHAQVLHAAGSSEAALARLDELTSSQETGVDNLKTAAELYKQLNQPIKSRTCLQKATFILKSPDGNLLAELAKAYASEDNPVEALNTIDRALEIDPTNEDLIILHCDLLRKLDRSSDARDYLQSILSSPPNDTWSTKTVGRMYTQLAELLREEGNPDQAMDIASQALKLEPDDQFIRHLILQLQRACLHLDPESIHSQIQQMSGQAINDPDYPLTLVESALESNLFDEAAQASDLFCDSADPVRLAAVKARLDALAGDALEAFEQYQLAQAVMDEQVGFSLKLSRLIGLTQTALCLKQWKKAVEFGQAAHTMAPNEPLAALLTLKAIIFEAEENKLYDRIKIQCHRPDPCGLTVNEYHELLAVLPSAEQNATIRYWKARGDNLFGLESDKHAFLQPPDMHPNELAGSQFILIAANMIKEVDRIFETNPLNREVLKYHAAALLETEPDSSAADAERLLELDPEDPVALVIKAFASQNDPIIAFGAIEKALSIWNNEPEWHIFATKLSQITGNTHGRIDHALELIKLYPDSGEYQVLAGCAYLEAGQADQAIHCLKRATLLDPDAKNGWMSLGQAYHAAGNFTESLSAFEHAITIDPSDIEPVLLSGKTALSLKSYDLAEKKANQALALEPEEPRGLLLLTSTLASQNKHLEALKIIEASSSTLRKSVPIQVEQLLLTQVIKGPKAIVEQLETLGARNRESPEVLKALAECYSTIGQYEEAEQAAMDALKLVANDAGLHYLAGKLQRTKGQIDQSIDHLSESIRLEPSNIETYLELARAYEDRRQFDQAIRIYQQATIVSPSDYRPYYQAGILLKDGKDFAAAEVMFKHAVDLNPGDMNIRSQLGALMALNFVHHAQEAFTRS